MEKKRREKRGGKNKEERSKAGRKEEIRPNSEATMVIPGSAQSDAKNKTQSFRHASYVPYH